MIVGRQSPQFPVRFPEGMREKLKLIAARNGRSMNTEIIMMLQSAIDNAETAQTPEKET